MDGTPKRDGGTYHLELPINIRSPKHATTCNLCRPAKKQGQADGARRRM